MSRKITQRELRNDSGRIMRALEEGRTFIVTRNGAPLRELRPIARRAFVSAEVVIAAFRGAPRIHARRLRHDLDAAADQDLTPRD